MNLSDVGGYMTYDEYKIALEYLDYLIDWETTINQPKIQDLINKIVEYEEEHYRPKFEIPTDEELAAFRKEQREDI